MFQQTSVLNKIQQTENCLNAIGTIDRKFYGSFILNKKRKILFDSENYNPRRE